MRVNNVLLNHAKRSGFQTKIEIISRQATAQTDYQIRVEDIISRKGDGEDITFAQKGKILDHWKESCTSWKNDTWISLPKLPVTKSQMVQILSGCPSISNGSDVFPLLFDDFESYNTGDLNGQGNWSGDTDYDVSTEDVYHGSYSVKCITGVDALTMSKTISLSGNYIFHIAGKISANGIRWEPYLNDVSLADVIGLYIDEFNDMYYYSGTGWIDLGINWTSGAWHYADLYCKPNAKQDIYYDGNKIVTDGTRDTTDMVSINFYLKLGTGTGYFDDLHIRKYVSPEPIVIKRKTSDKAEMIRSICGGILC